MLVNCIVITDATWLPILYLNPKYVQASAFKLVNTSFKFLHPKIITARSIMKAVGDTASKTSEDTVSPNSDY